MTGVGNYIEASLAFIESQEMRDYLRDELSKFCQPAMACADIVAYAPAPIERKLSLLEQIVQETGPELVYDGEPFTASASRFAQSCRIALEERYSGPDGAIFWLRSNCYEKDVRPYIFDDSPIFTTLYTEFDAAIRYLEQLAQENPDDYTFEGLNYTITKYVPDGKGGLKAYCTWYLNNARELWYFDYEISLKETPENWDPLFACGELNLPVPFQPGDIVVADCLPYAAPRRTLILNVGDNRDCCCLWSLSVRKDGQLFAGAFKHNSFLRHSFPEMGDWSQVSGLYRAARWTGELSAEEEPFAVLSPLIHAKPELGIELDDYLSREGNSKSWLEVKTAFGL